MSPCLAVQQPACHSARHTATPITFEFGTFALAHMHVRRYLLLCKIYISLCNINKSAEVDYYKIRCDNGSRIIIPMKFSKARPLRRRCGCFRSG